MTSASCSCTMTMRRSDPVADRNGAFVYVTREGSMGLIETTDRVTQTADLTGMPAGNAPAGVGFKTGVRFNLKSIVP